jgi:hypothetical protein
VSWAVGYDSKWKRDIGYGVIAYCDHPDCEAVIDRGLSFVCGGEPYGGERGCGLHFCASHLYFASDGANVQLCDRCSEGERSFEPKPDHPDWIKHKETDASWAEWRALRAAPKPEGPQ